MPFTLPAHPDLDRSLYQMEPTVQGLGRSFFRPPPSAAARVLATAAAGLPRIDGVGLGTEFARRVRGRLGALLPGSPPFERWLTMPDDPRMLTGDTGARQSEWLVFFWLVLEGRQLMTPQPGVCRWGVLGAAVIARKFWQAVRLSGTSSLGGIAARSAERAEEFVRECQSRFPVATPPQVYEDYESLLKSPDIDAVYVPLPTGVRKPWVIMAAKHGKHVLCEKPCAASPDDLRDMLEACQQSGVQFMDNVMFMHSQRIARLKSLLHQEHRIGQIRRIATQFSFLGDESFFAGNIRSHSQLEPWGCLGDLGWYCIQICLLAMNDEMPVRVSGRIMNPVDGSGMPLDFSGEMFFAGGVSASLYCSFINQHQQWVHISGTEGTLMIDDYVLPCFGNQLPIRYRTADFNRTGYDFNYERRSEDLMIDEYANGHASAQEVRLVRHFAELIQAGSPDPYWPMISQQTQRVMQALWDAAKSGRDQNL